MGSCCSQQPSQHQPPEPLEDVIHKEPAKTTEISIEPSNVSVIGNNYKWELIKRSALDIRELTRLNLSQIHHVTHIHSGKDFTIYANQKPKPILFIHMSTLHQFLFSQIIIS